MRYKTVPNGTPVKGRLSYSNSNCVMVTVTDDGYLIHDSKLGDDSPVWQLAHGQFHAIGRALDQWMGRGYDLHVTEPGLVFAQERTGPGEYRWSLGGSPPLAFTFDEVAAFCWAYHHHQWPEGQPARELVSAVRARWSSG
jgi:hypothetical protein